ncbi:MAG TPA: hypothetical protein VGW36_01190 [Pyrinomonadaceae bacterium]|nr:hypothetical protein [Pyrinomonadaceae bacterium]
MSKRILRVLILVALSATAAAVVSLDLKSNASQTQRAAVAKSNSRNASIVATTAAVLQETSEIRQLAILRPVRSGAQSRAEIEKMLVKNLNDQMTPAEMHATEVGLRKFGLAPADFEYRPFIIKLLTEQVAGYYDTKSREFRLADWLELEGQKPVMAHELTHALQDQHFNLRRFEKWPKGDSDAHLAAHALIEGDATLAMTIYMAKNPLVALAFSRSLLSTGISSEQFNKAPRALRESLVFPYTQGTEWATHIYKRGGWPGISKAYSRLPQSTEHILHPDKYASYERPVKVALPEVKNLLGPNWKRLDYDVNGEWGLYLILDQFLKDPALSRRATAGWGGDRYALYELKDAQMENGKPGEVFMAQMTMWDSEDDAREFFDAYVKRTALRYSASEPIKESSDNIRRWNTSEGAVTIELRGLRVLIIEGVPPSADGTVLLKELWL